MEPTAEQIAAKEKVLAARKARMEAVKIALDSAPQNENVRVILRFLHEISGAGSNPVCINEQREVTNATNYNVGRQSVFFDMAKLMSAETENLITKREVSNV